MDKDTSYHDKKDDMGKLRYDLIEYDILINAQERFDAFKSDGFSECLENLDKDELEALIQLCILSLGGMYNAKRELAKVYTYGANKYGDNSWKTVPDAIPRYTAALHRHLDAFMRGEYINAEDSNVLHIAQVMWNAISLIWFMNNKEQ